MKGGQLLELGGCEVLDVRQDLRTVAAMSSLATNLATPRPLPAGTAVHASLATAAPGSS